MCDLVRAKIRSYHFRVSKAHPRPKERNQCQIRKYRFSECSGRNVFLISNEFHARFISGWFIVVAKGFTTCCLHRVGKRWWFITKSKRLEHQHSDIYEYTCQDSRSSTEHSEKVFSHYCKYAMTTTRPLEIHLLATSTMSSAYVFSASSITFASSELVTIFSTSGSYPLPQSTNAHLLDTSSSLLVIGPVANRRFWKGSMAFRLRFASEMCTRFATQIFLRRAPASEAEVRITIIPGPDAQGDEETLKTAWLRKDFVD